MFNSLPNELKLWTGTKDAFKIVLDEFLTLVPDEPETDDLVPSAKDIMGKPSNSMKDWLRVSNIDYSMID